MRYVAVAGLLGATCVIWSAVPWRGTGAPGVLFVVVATGCVLAGLLRLVLKDSRPHQDRLFGGVVDNLAGAAHAVLLDAPWETGAAVSAVVLEALHRGHPWHSGLLGAALACYLLAVHQAESAVPRGVWRGQSRALLTGLVLLALTTGVAMVPQAGAGAVAGWLEIAAAVAAMVAAGLALPA